MASPDRKSKLEGDDLSSAASSVPDWEIQTDRLRRRFEFANFSEAFAFMTRVAMAAEKLDHHPNWSNVWNTVDIEVTNHEAPGGITDVDVELCRRIDALL